MARVGHVILVPHMDVCDGQLEVAWGWEGAGVKGKGLWRCRGAGVCELQPATKRQGVCCGCPQQKYVPNPPRLFQESNVITRHILPTHR